MIIALHPSLVLAATGVAAPRSVTIDEAIASAAAAHPSVRMLHVLGGRGAGDLVELFGSFNAGERGVLRATDELRDGTPVQARSKQGS